MQDKGVQQRERRFSSFVGACCASLRMVAISLRYTGLPGEVLDVWLRAVVCFCAPVLPSLLPYWAITGVARPGKHTPDHHRSWQRPQLLVPDRNNSARQREDAPRGARERRLQREVRWSRGWFGKGYAQPSVLVVIGGCRSGSYLLDSLHDVRGMAWSAGIHSPKRSSSRRLLPD